MAVTPIGAGETFTDLSSYESVKQSTHGATETARLVTDIIDNVTFGSWGICIVTIEGDTSGYAKKKISSAVSAATILRINDTSIRPIMRDFIIDGTNQTDLYGIQIANADTDATIKRVSVFNTFNRGIYHVTNVPLLCENTFAFNCGSSGFRIDGGNSILKNCGAYANGLDGFNWGTAVTINNSFYNCWSFNNTGIDFENTNSGAGEATSRLEECVSSDTTATDAEAQRTVVGGAVSKTDYTAYFADPNNATIASRDFRLLDDGNALWGIDGNGAQTPANDYSSKMRANNDIGPHEFVVNGGALACCARFPGIGISIT